jgi:DNA-binding PadR family transcriptional regulator
VPTEGPAGQRRTSLRFAILGLLTRRAATGYDIKRDFDRTIGYAWNAHDSQLYPELRKLEDDGLIEVAEPEEGGRRRRAYRLTDAGQAALDLWLTEPVAGGFTRDEFVLRLFFFHLMDAGARRAAIEAELTRLDGELELLKRTIAPYREIPAATAEDHPLRWQLAAAHVVQASTRARAAQLRRLLDNTYYPGVG